MKIRGTEYAILFWIEDENTSETVFEKLFSDFEELNAFFENGTEYAYCEEPDCKYSFVEVTDGEPGGILFEKSIDFLPLDEEEIEDEIASFLKCEEEMEEFRNEFWDDNLKFTPAKGTCANDYATKRTSLSEYSYICPNCMYELEECKCASYPYNLIQIDKTIVPLIRQLNTKGYMTMSSCGGHPKDTHSLEINLSFYKHYSFEVKIPAGGRYESGGVLRYRFPPDATLDERVDFQKKTIAALNEWADNLPSMGKE